MLVFRIVKYLVLVSAMNKDDLALYVSAWTVAWFFFWRETIVRSVTSSNGWWPSVGTVR